jgi:putative adenylate-forming enzyme
MSPVAEIATSFWTSRRLSRPGLGRTRFEDLQARALCRWLVHDLPRVAAYPTAPGDIRDLPILDKAQLMANFADYNVAGITAEAVQTALSEDFRISGYTVGASTGTSGNRGYFVISEAERYRWLGSILAKTLADLLWQRQRVAILLPQDTRLYGSARTLPRLQLQFFSLSEGIDRWRRDLERYDPTVIVAPPKVLRHMVETRFRLSPRRVFSAAETLDPVDRPIIEAGFGLPLDQIYMATEGLLAVTCRAGQLHLAEDSIFFEFEPVGGGLVSPLITCFRRQTQIMARYRMNDLLRLSDRPCRCGSPLIAVEEIVGRMDDCFRLVGPAGEVLVTPDILRNAVVRTDAGITDYRILQLRKDMVELVLPPDTSPEVAGAARASLLAALRTSGALVDVALRLAPLPVDFSRKLRRVECRLSVEARQ